MWKRFVRSRRGSVLTLVAMSMLAIMGVAAFAVDLGGAFVARSQDQRLADLAAYAGAITYQSTQTMTAVDSAVARIATLNGLSSDAITASLVSSPTGDGNSAVEATVATTSPLYLGGVLTGGSSMAVGAAAFAEIRTGTPGCITALQASGTGISVTGGTSITANGCAVASNGTVPGENTSVYVHCGARITTLAVDYASAAAPVQSGCTDILPPSGTASVTFSQTVSVDKLASNTEVTAATSRISVVSAIASPAAPVVTGGSALNFGYYPTTMSSPPLPAGCTASLSHSVWNVSCPESGTFTFGPMALGGGLALNLGSGDSEVERTFNFAGDINGSSGSAINLGAANYNIAGGIVASGSMVITFSNGGTFNIGTTSSCSGGSGYSICLTGSSRLNIPGPGTFTLTGGIYQGASGMPSVAALTLGSGSSGNSFVIGASSAGYSLNNANGAAILGDANDDGSAFTMAGGIATSGGTCVALGAAAEHDINGSVNAAGGIDLGAGVYTINGYASFGASDGGDVSNCPTSGTVTGLTATGVSLILSGASTTSCNGYAGSAFCLGAGYAHVQLTAPSTSSAVGSNTAGLAVIGPTSSSLTGSADFTTGATDTQITGVFYFPYGAINVSGGAQLQDAGDPEGAACLELIGAEINLSGGGVLGSTCVGLPGSLSNSGSGVALVQ
ncbi:MAG: hypothetical protein B7Z80_24905 [Rhodospirillales bacterium 20-64-7]|nr:MAG: hypothetical protein B7Z80_24905 [Rhodospirillales bacterium 20-64-7]HQT78833.1 pilus assembly protein TadG-related protein [Rhodopila sp.]